MEHRYKMGLEELIAAMEQGRSVMYQRYPNETPFRLVKIEAVIPDVDRRGEPDWTVIARDRSGCRYTVSARHISPDTESEVRRQCG